MNKAVDVPAINKMMADFERENAKTEMMQEIMGDAIDDALGDADNEDEEDRIVSQVLDEIGISFGDQIPDAPMLGAPGMVESAPSGKTATAIGGDDPALSDLEARLNNLKR
jgi:charged multivesicular body protein 2A